MFVVVVGSAIVANVSSRAFEMEVYMNKNSPCGEMCAFRNVQCLRTTEQNRGRVTPTLLWAVYVQTNTMLPSKRLLTL